MTPRREFLAPVFFALILMAGCQSGERAGRPSADASNPVRITQFYATSPMTPRGEATNLCYGVENATSVSIDPPVESLKPALSRCISVTPERTTIYTLTAEDPSGRKATQSVTIRVTGPRLQFDDLSISAKEVARGEAVNFCFKAQNAAAVRGGPGRFLSGGSAHGDCLVDHPMQTTTYRLTITGVDGQTDEESVTVTVR